MPQKLTSLLTHILFSTKKRRATIGADLKTRLHAYFGGIVRELGGKALAVGGTADHVHLLVSLPAAVSVAEAVRVLKTRSAKWVREGAFKRKALAWQAGYAAFSVSEPIAAWVAGIIRDQEIHHRKMSLRDELLLFVRNHHVRCDERHLWD